MCGVVQPLSAMSSVGVMSPAAAAANDYYEEDELESADEEDDRSFRGRESDEGKEERAPLMYLYRQSAPIQVLRPGSCLQLPGTWRLQWSLGTI